MLRTIDTVRATFAPNHSTREHKVRLLGEPILVMVGRLQLELTAESDPRKLQQDPPPVTALPALPSISVRIGDISRPDDGVLGIFSPSDSPESSRYAPLSKEVAEKAILNGLTSNLPVIGPQPVTHPFVKDQPNSMKVTGGAPPTDVVLLTDIRGAIYITSGVLPRKSLAVPKDSLDASLAQMQPVLRVGPVLTALGAEQETLPLFPPPQVSD